MAPDPSFPVDQKKREECLDQLATLYRGLNDGQKKMIVTSYMADPDLVNDGKATPLFHKKYDEWAMRAIQELIELLRSSYDILIPTLEALSDALPLLPSSKLFAPFP